MPDFSHSLRDAIEADARANLGAEALPGTRRTIARRRRATAAGYGAGSVLAVGGLAVGGVLLSSREDPAPASAVSPTPSPSSEAPIAYATIDLNEAELLGLGDVRCGTPAPTPGSTDDDFSASFDFADDPVIDQADDSVQRQLATIDVRGSLEDRTAMFRHEPVGALVRGGEVVGFTSWPQETRWSMLAADGGYTQELLTWGATYACTDDGTYQRLPAGEYQLYALAQVTASEEEAGIFAVRAAGLRLTGRSELDTLAPGSWECERYADWDSAAPLLCDVDAMPGASLDREAGLLTVPYETHLFDREIDALMASEPVTVTVTEYVDVYDQWRNGAEAPPGLDAGTVPACGEEYAWVEGGEVVLDWSNDAAGVSPGDVLEPGMWLGTPSWDTATVDMPATATAWMFESYEIPLNDTRSAHALRMVGSWDVTAVGDTSVDVSRYDGPQPWALEVADVTWCEGAEGARVAETVLMGEHTIADEAGTRTSTDPIPLQPLR